MAAIARRYEWGCEPPQCTDDRGTMLVWIGELEQALAEARAERDTFARHLVRYHPKDACEILRDAAVLARGGAEA